MDKLTPDILTLILSFINGPLHQYSTISRRWQQAVESHTIHTLQLLQSDTPVLAKLFRRNHSHRIALLSEIDLTFNLVDQANISHAFAESIQSFFQALHDIESTNDLREPGIKLSISCRSTRSPISSTNNTARLLYLDNLLRLPSNNLITHLICPPSSSMVQIEPAACLAMAAALPRLSVCDMAFFDEDPSGAQSRQRMRNALPSSLLYLSMHQLPLRELTFNYEHQPHSNEDIAPPVLLSSPPPSTSPNLTDSLSRAFHIFTQRQSKLETLNLTGSHMISPSLFWSGPSESISNLPLWPALRELRIEISVAAPDGRWYFDRDPQAHLYTATVDADSDSGNEGNGEESTDEDEDDDEDIEMLDTTPLSRHFRTRPSAHLSALLLLIARAAHPKHMPALQSLSLAVPHSPEKLVDRAVPRGARGRYSVRQFEMLYCAEHVPLREEFDTDRGLALMTSTCERKRLVWVLNGAGSGWRPGSEVALAWREVLGREGVVLWGDRLREG